MTSLQHILAGEPDDQHPSPAQSTAPAPAPAPAQPPAPPAPPLASFERNDDSADAMRPKKRVDEDTNAATPRADSSRPAENGDGDEPMYTSTTTSTRRNANGATSSVYSGNKIRHLKKEDGIPLWRKDIQYDFLRLVFDDTTKCFTKYSDGTKGHTFADIYIDAMAKSSKCSKILKEKLLQDQDGAISMAMVCLLVNVGRMNTTLNFFPEMRAQLRTYHSIPALQAHQDPNAYKQLQDAPRLKSILKGATEDEPQPSTMEDIKAASIPRTNPVNLIFVMSQYAPKISEVHFPPPRDFFDLVMRPSLSSASRAKAFLWLIWWYLESDFSVEDSQRNPFGAGQPGDGEEGPDAQPLKVPTLESLTEEQAELENVDTEEEKHFGEVKRKERISILASEPSPAMTALKRARKEKGLTTGHGAHPSDDEGSELGYHTGHIPPSVGKSSALRHETGSEYTRSPSPVGSRGFQAVNVKPVGDMRINNLLNDDTGPDMTPTHATPAVSSAKKGPGRGNWRRKKPDSGAAPARSSQADSHHVPLLPNTGQINFVNDGPQQMMMNTPIGGSKLVGATGMSPPQSTNISFAAPNAHVPTPSYQAQKRNRGITQHQSAVINHRKLQIDYALEKRIRRAHARARDKRESEGAIIRAWKRIRMMPPDYDSEEEQIKIRKARDRTERNDDDWRLIRGKENDDFLENIDLWRRPRALYAGFAKAPNEPSDVGEEAKSLAQTFRRCSRRIDRWQETNHPGQAMMLRKRQEEQGIILDRRRVVVRQRTFEQDDDAVHAGPAAYRRQGDEGLPNRPAISRRMSKAGREANTDEGEGELDEEDRELLGEVDADESEEDDGEDEDMDD
ncbi:hypothetical protein DOTSEDRAFT_75066 [Dothistroma septosporum NZE10]|uniref:Ino eighty subunit 1 n=1 Tax=Dothistroma septosporum (strain NZE10 / CBS 128990) TaxID=675120 RepID=M2XIA9_DOTSN|nr:hypothetical protein DOTSEDRAFT_75066 [Dothistroma septosporum NZE10]